MRVWNYMSRTGGGAPVPDSEPPADLDWDAWLGPAPKVPFNNSRLDYRSWMDYTNGIISDYGNHRFDSVHQIMGAEIPLKVSSSALRFDKNRAGDIYDFQQATYEYPDFILSYEASIFNGHGLGGRTPGQRYYGMRGTDDRPHGMAFYGTQAALFVDRIGMELYPEPRGGGAGRGGRGARRQQRLRLPRQPLLERMHMNEDEPTPLHTKYFVDYVRSRKDPFANIEVGVRATAISCMGNVAAWTGRKLTWDAETWQFKGDAEANKYLFRDVSQALGFGEVRVSREMGRWRFPPARSEQASAGIRPQPRRFPILLTMVSMSSMTLSGVEVPAVMPVTSAPRSHSARTSAAVCTWKTRAQCRRQVATSSRVLLLRAPPTTRMTSAWRASSSADSCRRRVGRHTVFINSISDRGKRCRMRAATRSTRSTGCVVWAAMPNRGRSCRRSTSSSVSTTS